MCGRARRSGYWEIRGTRTRRTSIFRLWIGHRVWTVRREEFAIDWIRVDAQGRLFHGDPKDVKNWYDYGADVLAVGAGTVVEVVRDLPDEPPGASPTNLTMGQVGGNRVIIDMGNGRYAEYEHLVPNSPNYPSCSTGCGWRVGFRSIGRSAPVDRVHDKSVWTNLLAASIPIYPTIALEWRAQYHRRLAIQLQRRARHRELHWLAVVSRYAYRHTMRYRRRNVRVLRIRHIEMHDRRLSWWNLRCEVRLVQRRRSAENPELRRHILVFQRQNQVFAGHRIALHWIDNLNRPQRRRVVPRIREQERVRQMCQPIRAFHGLNRVSY
jgi:hypothetical protein